MNSVRTHAYIRESEKSGKDAERAGETTGDVHQPLRIVVPYTSPELCKASLNAIASLSKGLRAVAVVVAVQEVPYPLPLDRPDVQPRILLRQLRALATGISCPVRIELVLARCKRDAFQRAIGPGSLVLIAAKKHWWRTTEEKLARDLLRAGCRVELLKLPASEIGLLGKRPSLPAAFATAGATVKEVNRA